jgi:preprotein translocase subunit SecD
MKNGLIYLLAIACTVLGCKHVKPVSFGIFEVVDCAQSQTAPVPYPAHNQKYCLASKAILAESDLRSADVTYDSIRGVELNLYFTSTAGNRLSEETKRISEANVRHGAKGRAAVVVDGKILIAPVLRAPTSWVSISGVFKKGEAEQLAASLNATATNRQ